MSKLRDIAHEIAVRMGKADSMRISASEIATGAVTYLRSDEGVADAIAEGLSSPTLYAFFHEMVVTDKAYPRDYASFGSFKRLLRIGGDPERDKLERQTQAETDQRRPPRPSASRNSAAPARTAVLTEPDEFVGQPVEITMVWVEPPEGPAPNGIIRAWFDFPAAREEFLDHLRNNGYEIAKIRKGA